MVDVDSQTGLPLLTPNEDCVHSVAEMQARGFKIIETMRGILCTEVHFNGPFHLQFKSAVVQATAIDSDYDGVHSTHRVVLQGNLPGPRVAFQAMVTPICEL